MMAQCLKAHAAFVVNLSLIPCTYVEQLTITCNSNFRGIQHLWPFRTHAYMNLQLIKNRINKNILK